MKYLQIRWNLLTMVTAIAAAVWLSSFAYAASPTTQKNALPERTIIIEIDDVTPTGNNSSTTTTQVGTPPPAQQPETQESLLKKYLHDTSFDKAAVSNQNLSRFRFVVRCKNEASQPCIEAKEKLANQNEVVNAAAKIAKEQAIMADVSRVSDVAGAASVGVAVVKEMTLKPTQASSLQSTANIEKVGATASMVAGATDIALASRAYFSQVKQLEELQAGVKMGKAVDPKVLTQLQDSIKKTKEAAFNHAAFGAAKIGAGMYLNKMAKDNLNQKTSLENAAPKPQYYTVPIIYGTPPTGGSTTSFSPTPGTGGSSGSGSTGSGGTGGSTGSSSAANALKFPYKADPLAKTPVAPSQPSGGLSSISKSGSSTGASKGEAKTADNTTKEALKSFEYGSGSGFKVGRSPASEGDLAGMLSNILNPGAANAATGINPNTLAAETGINPDGGAGAGISEEDKSLFEVTRAKYLEMWEQGRLAGKGALK